MKSIISLYALCIMAAQAVLTDSQIDSQVEVTDQIEDTSAVDEDCCIFYDTEFFMIDTDDIAKHRYEACVNQSFFGERLENAESLLSGHPFNDSILSVRCGNMTGVTLCVGTYTKDSAQDANGYDTYKCNDDAFAKDVARGESFETLVSGNVISSVIIRPIEPTPGPDPEPEPEPDTCPDFEMTVYDEPYCQGNSNVITEEEYRLESELNGATFNLAGQIRSIRHPGKTRVDIYSAEQFAEFSFTSRNDKEAVNAVDGNKICTSWRLGDIDAQGTIDQKSLWFRPEDDCYNEE